MPGLAKLLSTWLARPVEDRTGLEGDFDLTLAISRTDIAQMKSGEGGSVFGAVRDTGLKLEPVGGPARFVVVEKANRVPTEN